MYNSKAKKILILAILVFASSCIRSTEKYGNRIPSSESKIDQFLDQDDQMSLNFELEEIDSLIVDQVSPSLKEDDQFIYYTAAPGETLMLLAFKYYTDHMQWRKILNANRDKLGNSPDINKYIELRLPKPLKRFNEPNGMPYLIKQGDSLSLISRKVYGEMKWWEHIWKNNQKMISNPNLIFAGFTLFYPSKDQDTINSEFLLF